MSPNQELLHGITQIRVAKDASEVPYCYGPFPTPLPQTVHASFRCTRLSSFQKPLRIVHQRIPRQHPLFFCTPCRASPCTPLSSAPRSGVTPTSTTATP